MSILSNGITKQYEYYPINTNFLALDKLNNNFVMININKRKKNNEIKLIGNWKDIMDMNTPFILMYSKT